MGQRGGTYGLLLFLEEEACLPVGKLGEFVFSSGYYLYLGSALGNLGARIRRHLKAEKILRWHIDYLRREATVVEVWYQLAPKRQECLWRRAALALPGAQTPVPGFGSSDCNCDAHLVYLPTPPSLETFALNLGGPRPKIWKPQSCGGPSSCP